MDIERVIKYVDENRVNSVLMVGTEYKTLKACKIASYFKPYIAWHKGELYMKGKNLIGFEENENK